MPEQMVIKDEFSESEPDSARLQLEIKMCDLASDSSSAMTPRILLEQELKKLDVAKVYREVEFSDYVASVKLSPQQVARAKELTNQRLRELEQTPENRTKINRTINYSYLDRDILDSDRAARRREIIERLENLV